jgi:hypothetical protein
MCGRQHLVESHRYNLNEADAKDCCGDEPDMVVEQIKMHKEVFDNLPEFEGF